ncbi:MAG: polyribonucleotide nucleotidyltransferase [Planctomycetota bacterium]
MESEKRIHLGDREIILESGKIARQAHGSVLVRSGDTVVLVTAVAAESTKPGVDFLPLTVEYHEGVAATGKIPGGYLKREGRLADHEVLSSRLIDRSIRPLFPKSFRAETQVLATVLSAEEDHEPAPLAILGAAAALTLSDIPFHGPAAGLRAVRLRDRLTFHPTRKERSSALFDLVVSCGPRGVTMIEGGGTQATESEFLELLFAAESALQPVLVALKSWADELGIDKRALPPDGLDATLFAAAEDKFRGAFTDALTSPAKLDRRRKTQAVTERAHAELAALDPQLDPALITEVLSELVHRVLRELVLNQGRRADGRSVRQIRPITAEASWLPRAHGSALFTRGETQAMVTCTLGSQEDAQTIETIFGTETDRFLLQYNFPPYSVGEVRASRGPSRREVGHGALARRALQHVLPGYDKFPYVVRVVSDISESNGSSSMATVCGGCLALMDAGVPLSSPVAGIAMGLIQEGDRVAVLSDILGDEDHLGDMDFKVAGTDKSITAVQMDNKIGGLRREVLKQALEQAREGRLHILAEMQKCLAKPRPQLSKYAPRVMSLRIRPERIRELIGPRGKTIQDIQAATRARINVDDSGLVIIYASDEQSFREAKRQVQHVAGDLEVGKLYRGTVVAVKEFGAFVRLLASTEGLVHVSELAAERFGRVSDVVKEGDEIVVRVLGVDGAGKIRLSRKEALGASLEDLAG